MINSGKVGKGIEPIEHWQNNEDLRRFLGKSERMSKAASVSLPDSKHEKFSLDLDIRENNATVVTESHVEECTARLSAQE